MAYKFILILIISALVNYLSAQKKEPLGINLEGYQYPFRIYKFPLKSQQKELTMVYMHEKAITPKGTVMLLHGKNFNGAYWGETMKALLEKGYNVFVPDQIGFGKSDKPAHYQYSFQQLAINTKAILDSLKINKLIVLGHSMGGMLATRFALMYPGIVEQLILENPIGLEDWKKCVPYKPIEFWYEREMKKNAPGVKEYMMKNYFKNQWKPEYDEWLYLQVSFINHPDYPRYAWNAALTYDMIFTQPVVYEFENIKVPTVLIIGQNDRAALGKELVDKPIADRMGNYPILGKETAKKITGCKLIELEDIGHVPHIENFQLFLSKLIIALNK